MMRRIPGRETAVDQHLHSACMHTSSLYNTMKQVDSAL